jgi:UDP-4-amino-4,6-dideoxy-N-acetyl-beta-L-altrosamine N-acetyltransferase
MMPLADPHIALRPLGPEDKERLFSWRNSPAVYPLMLSDRKVSPEEHEKWFEGLGASGDHHWIIHHQGKPAGFLVIHTEKLPKSASFGMYIAEENLRRLKIGTAVMRFIETFTADSLHCNTLRCIALANNEAAIRFYRKHGFSIVEETRRTILFEKEIGE